MTIPRLELCAISLGTQLASSLIDIFKDRIRIDECHIWSDSEIALYWVNSSSSRWNVFVANRVAAIQSIGKSFLWHHVKSNWNPADLPSRGVVVKELLVPSHMWWRGPPFLSSLEINYEQFRMNFDLENISEEKKVVLSNIQVENSFWLLASERYSSLKKTQRIFAYVLRFVKNCRLSKTDPNRLTEVLTPRELDSATNLIVRELQQQYFSKEISDLKVNKVCSNKNLAALTPMYTLEDGFLRVGGRLENADLPYDQKHPILLPAHNRIVSLMLKEMHVKLGHAGAQTTLSNFRLKFWPLNGLREVKTVIHRCMICFRFKCQPMTQIMADIPKDRVTVSRPFRKVSIDYGGYFLIKSSNLRKAPITKAYIAIFVCLVTHAVHLELVSSLTTQDFLLALKRFISRRGNPTVIYSDNATNFFGARNQLKELHEFLISKEQNSSIKNYCLENLIEFKFLPPNAPHWGGLHESGIKSAKFHIYRLLGKNVVTFEVFYTMVVQIEAILNSRPLTQLSNDPNDMACLTPGHFLIGTSLTAYPELDVTLVNENRLDVYQKISQAQQLFWNRWVTDYLNQLQHRPKWRTCTKNLEVNELVLVKNEENPPLLWPLGRIVETYMGRDQKVRSVKVKTRTGEYVRPITKICRLPSSDL